MVPWPEAASAQPLGARCSQSFRVLPLLSPPPYSPGWAEGENRAGLQGMARNKMPPSPSRGGGGPMPRAPTWPEDRGTGISVQGRLWDSTGRHSLDRAQPEKAGHLGRGWGSFWSLLIPSPPPGPNTRHLLGSNCLRTERQKERVGRICPSPSQPIPPPQQKPGSWGEPRLTSREEPGLSGAWTRGDGTHVDSVASGGIWGSQGAGAPYEIHAAFKVSECLGVMGEGGETASGWGEAP